MGSTGYFFSIYFDTFLNWPSKLSKCFKNQSPLYLNLSVITHIKAALFLSLLLKSMTLKEMFTLRVLEGTFFIEEDKLAYCKTGLVHGTY